jgi:intracellular septation protein
MMRRRLAHDRLSTQYAEMTEIKPELQAPPSWRASPILKFGIELGPLVAFFAAYGLGGIYWATGVLMAATLAALVASKVLYEKLAPMPLVTAVIVCVFGGLTFWLNDPSFVKMKPTMVNLIFAGVLGAGLLAGRPLIKMLFGAAFSLTEEGWRQLTIRWMVFFLAMAAVNEIVWRNFSEQAWVNFKVFGILPLTMIFALCQVGLLRRHELPKSIE